MKNYNFEEKGNYMRRKNFLSLVLIAVVLITLALPEGLIVYADGTPSYTFNISQGDITISKDTGDNIKVTYGSGLTQYNITTDEQIIITGTTEKYTVKADGVSTNVMLSNANIQFHIDHSADDNKCAFELTGGADVTLTLMAGTNNILKSGRNKAGIGVPDGQSLKIQGTGALDAISVYRGAGIGGSDGETGGNITIAGGEIRTTGGACGAGIGGGSGGTGGTIRILNGNITAIGGRSSDGTSTCGAGIGGGKNGSGGKISIEGGTVTAIGGGDAAGIGGGQFKDGGTINITGGDVTATGGNCAAGIGGGYGNYDGKTTGGAITIDNPNGKVIAIGGAMGGAGIGGGLLSSGGMITIKQGIVEATGGSKSGVVGNGGAGIGGGNSGAGGIIQILGGEVTATGGRAGGAGIGGGASGTGGDITVKPSVILRAASDGIKAAIDIVASSQIETGVLIVNLPSVQSANTTASAYSIDSGETPYIISFSPAQDYKSIAFVVPVNKTYQLKMGDELQMNAGTPDFVVTGEGVNVFSGVTTVPESDKGALTDRDALTENLIKGTNPDFNHITSALANPLPSIGTNGSTITWQSGNKAVVSDDGQTVKRPAYGENDANVYLTATIKKGSVTVTKVFFVTVLANPVPSSGGETGNGKNRSISNTKSAEQVINQLNNDEKKAILKNFKNYMPYTRLYAGLTLEQLKQFTNNKFTDKQLQDLLNKPELLKKFGVDESMLSQPIVLNPVKNASFTDVSQTHWANGAIKAAAEQGFVAGMPDGSFAPNAPLQAADTFSFLDRVLLLNGRTEMKLSRSTVEKYINDKDHWAFLSMASIGSKLSEETLKSISELEDEPLSREYLAQVLYEITQGKLEAVREETDFKDITVSSYKEAINYCIRAGLLSGTDSQHMSPKKALTRAELMTILIRLNEKLK